MDLIWSSERPFRLHVYPPIACKAFCCSAREPKSSCWSLWAKNCWAGGMLSLRVARWSRSSAALLKFSSRTATCSCLQKMRLRAYLLKRPSQQSAWAYQRRGRTDKVSLKSRTQSNFCPQEVVDVLSKLHFVLKTTYDLTAWWGQAFAISHLAELER